MQGRVIPKTSKMVLTASLCDAPHLDEFEWSKYCEYTCGRVAAYLYAPILDHSRNTKEREIGSSTIYIVQCTCVDLIIIIINHYEKSHHKTSIQEAI